MGPWLRYVRWNKFNFVNFYQFVFNLWAHSGNFCKFHQLYILNLYSLSDSILLFINISNKYFYFGKVTSSQICNVLLNCYRTIYIRWVAKRVYIIPKKKKKLSLSHSLSLSFSWIILTMVHRSQISCILFTTRYSYIQGYGNTYLISFSIRELWNYIILISYLIIVTKTISIKLHIMCFSKKKKKKEVTYYV